jgi:hypothetical protein
MTGRCGTLPHLAKISIAKDLFKTYFALSDTSKSQPEPVEGWLLRPWKRKTRSEAPFDTLRVIPR